MEMKASLLAIKVKTKLFCFLLLVLTNISTINAQSKPRIDDFTPYTANVGSILTITGDNFSTNPQENIVYFGSVKATVITSDLNTITVIVPSGSYYAPITVTNLGLTGASKKSFGVSNSLTSNEPIRNNTFLTPVSYNSTSGTNIIMGTTSTSIAIAVADFDGDGKPDIVKGGNNSNVRVHLNMNSVIGTINSDTFNTGTDFTTVGQSWSVVAADFDGDGKKDIASVSTNNVSFLRNTSIASGNINFNSAINLPTTITSNIQAADINDDGKIDIVVSNGNSDKFKVYLNESSIGEIVFSTSAIIFGGAYSSRNITVGDVNMDGKPDVLLFGEKVYLYINNSTTTNVSFEPLITIGSTEYFGSLIDIDGDGDNDIVGNYSIIQNNIVETISSDAFSNDPIFTSVEYSKNTVGDINGDSISDIAILFSKDSNNKIFFIENKNTEGLYTSSLLKKRTNENDAFETPILCDIDGDNKLDLITSEGEYPRFKILKNNIGQEPVIITTGELNEFNRCVNETSSIQSIVVSGIRLLDDITITIPTGFEASLNSTDWSNSPIVLPTTGNQVLPTTVYFRCPSSFSSNANGIISLSSLNAISVNFNCNSNENIVATPIVTNPIKYCQNSIATAIQSNALQGHSIRWHNSSQTLLTSTPIPDTSVVGITTYFVSQVNDATGCESEKIAVNIIIYPLPVAVEINPSNATICKDSIQMLTTGSTNAVWYPTTGLYLDDQATINYNGTSESTVYAKISDNANYTATFSNGTICTTTSSCQLIVVESIGGDAIGGGIYPSNSPDVNLSLVNQQGSVIRWEKCTTPYTSWKVITNSATPNYSPGLFTVSTVYRAVVQNGPCSISYSTPTFVVVDNSVGNYYTTIGTSFWDSIVTFSTYITYNTITPINGDTITSYKVEVTNTSNNSVVEYQSSLPKFRIVDLPSSITNYNTTYSIKVSLQINGVWQPYGTAKNVITSNIGAPTISPNSCGVTLSSISKAIICNLVPLATSYIFEVNYMLNGSVAQTTTYTSNINSFCLTNLAYDTFSVKYGASYTVRVKSKYTSNGINYESDYGNSCIITTPNNPPVATITTGCGLVPSKTTFIKCTAYTSATLYKFELTNGVQVFQLITPLNKFSLSMVAGISPNANYTVTPFVKVFGQFYQGISCGITTPNVVAKTDSKIEESDAITSFKINAYPNPFENSYKIKLTDTKSDTIEIKVYDMFSNLLENKTLTVLELENLELGENYPTGIYNIIIIQDNNNQVTRVIKK